MKKFFVLKVMCFLTITAFFAGRASLNSLSDSGNGSRSGDNGSSSGANNGSQVKSPRPPAEQAASTMTDAELVAEAIKWGDCSFLYEYTQREGAKKNLVTQANNTIKQYAALSTNTSKYRNDKMEARVRNISKELMAQVFVDPAAALLALNPSA
ncbi:hypothetical protein AGMMS49587_02690 [Spirochaetia bacterium]|nr:hypothetical protein AGMMS49587_02690 [Spirochaetia bacterium]